MQIQVHQITKPKCTGFPVAVVVTLLILFLAMVSPGIAISQTANNAGDALVSTESMLTSLESAWTGQQTDLADLKVQVQELETLHKAVQAEINAYDSQNAAHAQLLLVPQLRIEDLKNALNSNRLSQRMLSERVKIFMDRWDSTSILLQQVSDRIELARTQMVDIREAKLPRDQQQKLEAATRNLIEVLQEKKQLVERYLKTSGQLLEQMKDAQKEKAAIGEKLTTQLASRQKTSLFKRSDPFQRLRGKTLSNELRYCGSRVQAVFTTTAWKALWVQIKLGGVRSWVTFLAILSVIIVLQGRGKVILGRIENKCEGPDRYYSRLGVYLLRHSLPYLDLALIFGLYSAISFSLLNIGLGRVLFNVFLVLLLMRWGLDYLKQGFRRPPTGLRSFVTRHLERFFRLFRIVALIGIILTWISGRDSLLIWLMRMSLSAVFLAWAVVFWRHMKLVVVEGVRDGQAAPNPKRVALLKGWSYLVFGGGLLLTLVGYSSLATLWTGAWIETVALLFWGWISLNAIREWRSAHQNKSATADEDHPPSIKHQWRWSLIQITRFVWLIALSTGLVWAWDPSGFLASQLERFFNATLTVGSLNFSINGVVLALIILFITHAAVRIGRSLLDEKFLNKRSLEPGLKDSILTITGYLGWGLGLLLVLGVIGVNATSLAVVFGALSVGIGFGLQTIFNNFISGLILLFERPIQVGDYIEIGGLWAEVKKINVRATVVQTFDNASVIIPNSEFISQRVTNWSFKDKRMRRIMEIGVAYGSDIDLVQKTLLDIVQKRRRVLNYPKPDVLFVDHADSALIFRLRFWVHVDDYWAVPSKIRFDIDRRFRELGIEIAFPQRDLHVRTLPEEITPVGSTFSPSKSQVSDPSEEKT